MLCSGTKGKAAKRNVLSVVKQWLITLNIVEFIWFLNICEFTITMFLYSFTLKIQLNFVTTLLVIFAFLWDRFGEITLFLEVLVTVSKILAHFLEKLSKSI